MRSIPSCCSLAASVVRGWPHKPSADNLHALRHTHASSLIAAGVEVLTISRRLGLPIPKITLSVYGHLYGNTDDKAAQAVEAMFARIGGTE